MTLFTYLHAEWLTHFSDELMIMLLGSFVIINMALKRLDLQAQTLDHSLISAM